MFMLLNIVIYFLYHFKIFTNIYKYITIFTNIFFGIKKKSSRKKSPLKQFLQKKRPPRKNATRKKSHLPKNFVFSFIFLVVKEGDGKGRLESQNKVY